MALRPEILAKSAELTTLCRRFHVKSLEAFGSATTERFNAEHSDLDFLVEFQTLAPTQYADSYFGLLESLERLFQREIDLITPGGIENKYFLLSINRSRTLVYAA